MISVDEQREMRGTIADLLDRNADSRRIRQVMAAEPGFDRQLWGRITGELGLAALLVPERCGGLGLEFADAAVVLEEFGRRLVPGPLPDTLVAAAVLTACGTDAADTVLSEIAEQGSALALAIADDLAPPESAWAAAGTAASASGPETLPTSPALGVGAASGSGEGWMVSGRKRFVPYGGAADTILVTATDGGEPALFAMAGTAADHPTGRRHDSMTLDATRHLADIDLDGAPALRVSPVGDGGAAVELLIELTRVAMAVECAAAADACLELTVDYLKVREQFGRPIGSFQALKHRCADHAVAVHGARSTAAAAAAAATAAVAGRSTDDERLAVIAPLAKAVCADVLRDVAADAIQLHGGIGFTFEHDAHLYFKRAKANQQLLGSPQALRRRIGKEIGL